MPRLKRRLGLALCVCGALAYNWWIAVPFIPGLMPSANGFFSDLEAENLRDAALFQHADLAAGLLMFAALLLRGPRGYDGVHRREWRWFLLFSASGVLGGVFVYACPEGTNAVCRNLEWHLHLPLHHYLHAVAGIMEFGAATIGTWLAARPGGSARKERRFRILFVVLCVGYPLLGAAYLSDRLGVLIEPVFFLAFSAMILFEVAEPIAAVPEGEHNSIAS